MRQRITLAKAKSSALIPYLVPSAEDLPTACPASSPSCSSSSQLPVTTPHPPHTYASIRSRAIPLLPQSAAAALCCSSPPPLPPLLSPCQQPRLRALSPSTAVRSAAAVRPRYHPAASTLHTSARESAHHCRNRRPLHHSLAYPSPVVALNPIAVASLPPCPCASPPAPAAVITLPCTRATCSHPPYAHTHTPTPPLPDPPPDSWLSGCCRAASAAASSAASSPKPTPIAWSSRRFS